MTEGKEHQTVGTVRWFSNDKGFGFIFAQRFCPPEGKPEVEGTTGDIFVHYSRIQTEERYKTLFPGQLVHFTPVQTTKGIQAIEVRPIQV